MVYLSVRKMRTKVVQIVPQVITVHLEHPIMSFIHALVVPIVLVRLKHQFSAKKVTIMICFMVNKLVIANYVPLAINVLKVKSIEELSAKRILTVQEDLGQGDSHVLLELMVET